jgi:hypothetical protein
MREISGIKQRIVRHLATIPLLPAAGCVFALSGCAQSSLPEPSKLPVAASFAARAQSCRPEPALLTPQSAPDCVFRRAELKTIDPDQWARLKIEYERQCYQNAERKVRERLRRLQAANRCEAEAALR